jgi:hypothetical protein
MKVYVVCGSTGEYSDHTEWAVCAYEKQEMAELLVTRLTQAVGAAAVSLRRAGVGGLEYEARRVLEAQLQLYDPECVIDYTGVRWWVQEVELRTEVPEVALDIEAIRQKLD